MQDASDIQTIIISSLVNNQVKGKWIGWGRAESDSSLHDLTSKYIEKVYHCYERCQNIYL